MRRVGVIGGGTMGAGIAQIAAAGGFETVLCEPVEAAGAAALARIESGLAKAAARSGGTATDAEAALGRLSLVSAIDELSGCELVVEAVPEQLELKREVFQRAEDVCGEETILATNTSSIPVTAIAAGVRRPERVVGMHFFNPVPVMRLVEVIAGVHTSAAAVAGARSFCEALGKTVIVAPDSPGFLVNRCGRPFFGEALRLLQERVATVEQIDRICRLGGGFRMGPFELMDLVGIDVNLAVARSFAELSFGEPRWKPNPLQQRLVLSGNLGRKTGRGWYAYTGESHRPPDPEAPAPAGAGGERVTVSGDGAVATELRGALTRAGADPVDLDQATIVVHADFPPAAARRDERTIVVSCAARSLAAWRCPGAVGFVLIPGRAGVPLVELTRDESVSASTAGQVERLFRGLGYHVEWVEDAPALVLGRIVAQLVNEACFAVGEGAGTAEDVDEGVLLGLNYPRGPFDWAASIGWGDVLETVDGLWRERREERYRPAPLLQRLALRETAAEGAGGG